MRLRDRIVRPTLDPRFDQPAETACESLTEAGKVLRTRRKELGWDQATAALVCDTNVRMISELERSARAVPFDTVVRYANRLGIDVVLSIREKK